MSNEIPQVLDGIQVYRGCQPGKDAKSCQAVKSSPCNMCPGIVLLECVGCTLQQGQNNRLYNLCDKAVHCQTAINVYQGYPVIKHHATPNHDAQCDARWNGLVCLRTRWWLSFLHRQKQDSFVNNTQCNSMVQVQWRWHHARHLALCWAVNGTPVAGTCAHNCTYAICCIWFVWT